MPFSRLAKSFLEQLEREHGAILIHICCKCDGKPAEDAKALLLFNEKCPIHGDAWHRLMKKLPDGSYEQAMPLKPR
jgi:hypothetical protein